MRTRPSMLPVALAFTALLLAGFGCKPILDAHVQISQGEAEKTRAFWLKEEPTLDYGHGPDLSGWITLDVHSQPGTTISAELFGPGILTTAYQSIDADKDGKVHFEWRTDRLGHYNYEGKIVFNRSLVQTFDAQFDTDIGP